jgi:hypothetical protein
MDVTYKTRNNRRTKIPLKSPLLYPKDTSSNAWQPSETSNPESGHRPVEQYNACVVIPLRMEKQTLEPTFKFAQVNHQGKVSKRK